MPSTNILLCTFLCNLVASVSLYVTGGGFVCSVPIFAFLLAILYYSGKPNESRKEGVIRATILSNVYWIWATDKRLVLLLAVFGIIRVAMNLEHPALETRQGGAYSLILFTALICALYVFPDKLLLLWRWLCGQQSGPARPAITWSCRVGGQLLVLAAMSCFVFLTYLIDGELIGLIQHLAGMGSCDPILERVSPYSELVHSKHTPRNWNASTSFPPVARTIRDVLMTNGELLGSMNTFLPILIGLYLLSRLLLIDKHIAIVSTLFYAVQASCVAGMVSAAVKHVSHRYRPSALSDPYVWTGGINFFNVLTGEYAGLDCSCPSGHATVTTAVATVIYICLIRHCGISSAGMQIGMATNVYWYSALVVLNRVCRCQHWPSDVLLGTLLGYCIGRVVLLGTHMGSSTSTGHRKITLQSHTNLLQSHAKLSRSLSVPAFMSVPV